VRVITPHIYQGDISDLNVFGKLRTDIPITMFVNVGSTNYIPPNRYAIHFPMRDEVQVNDWEKICSLAQLAAEEVRRGGLLFVNCDAGISRSVIFVGMVMSLVDGIDMDDKLFQQLRLAPSMDPFEPLWEEARRAIKPYVPAVYGRAA